MAFHRTPVQASHPVAWSLPVLPVFFAGVLGIAALGFVFSHPFLVILGLCFLGSGLRRRRWGRTWGRDWRWADQDLPDMARFRPRRGRSSTARQAHDRAASAVDRSTGLDEGKRAELKATLAGGLSEVEALLEAEARLSRAGEDDFRGVGRKARERAEGFEADCRKLEASLAALEIQDRGTDGLDAVAAAAEQLAGRVAATDEVDAAV